MTKKTTYIFSGIIFLLIAIIPLGRKIDAFKTQLTGQTIKVRVTYVPTIFLHNDVNYSFKFQYVDRGDLKEHSKLYFPKYCGQLKSGQELKLKADLNKDIFLYENEDVRTEFYAFSLLGLLGIVLLISGLKVKSAGS
ncbi:MAG: hypothetical protein V4580_06505 [Bacteroidota bacterium]